jgi:hypothetical protein
VRRVLAALVLALSVLASLGACSRPPPDSTPEGAVRLWLDALQDSVDDPAQAKAVYGLLGPTARANLDERAARASQVQGRKVEPQEMIAAGHFGLRFRPKRLSSTIEGENAFVDLFGDDPGDRAQLRCVHVGAAWRVEPELAPLQVLPRRGDAG